jgi:sugar phosphate isomerase/epimerase
MQTDQVALQLYTVRGLLADDLPGTLRAVSGAGYSAVELAGLPEIDPIELADFLAEAGLGAVASHEPIERLRADVDSVARRLTTLGCSRAIVPWLPERDRDSADAVRRVAAEIGVMADRLGDLGIRLGYHNHAFEFDPVDGTTAWDILAAELDTSVEFEIDVFWAAVGGRDPAVLIEEHRDRVRLLHMKDLEADAGPEPRDAPPGSGVLRWDGIVAAARAAGVEWYVVEQDVPGDPLADVTQGLTFLRGLATTPDGVA